MDDMEKPKNVGGRPRHSAEVGHRKTRSFRVRPSIDTALQRAADANNRSLSEEVEFRLTQSFEGMWLNVAEPFKQTVMDLAAHNLRSVEDELASIVARATKTPAKLRNMSSIDLAEYVRSELGAAARKAIEDDYELGGHKHPSNRGEKIELDLDFYNSISRRLTWGTQVDNAIRALAAVIDPENRRAEDQKIDQYHADMYEKISAGIIKNEDQGIIEGYAPGTYPKRKLRSE